MTHNCSLTRGLIRNRRAGSPTAAMWCEPPLIELVEVPGSGQLKVADHVSDCLNLVAKSNFRPQFGECKLSMSIIFDFATSSKLGA